MKNMTLNYKDVLTILYQIINYSIWYIVQSLPVLYQKGYQEFLESIDIQMVDRKKYYKNMHSLLGQMPFEELMKQSPMFVAKKLYFNNPYKDVILWSNQTGLEYDYYQKKILNKFLNQLGELDEEKLNINYEKYKKKYSKQLKEFYEATIEEEGFFDLNENTEILRYFDKSYKIYTNKNWCIIINRKFDEKQFLKANSLLLIDSHYYNPRYKVQNYRRIDKIGPREFYDSLNYPKPYSQANYLYACLDNLKEANTFIHEMLKSTIIGKNYILESTAKISNKILLEEMCQKKYMFIDSIENRADCVQSLISYFEKFETITQEEIQMYKKEMNNENDDVLEILGGDTYGN